MNPNLIIGAPAIDRQHSELFRSFQKLLSSGDSEESISDILSELTEQIYKHFHSEEQFMLGLGIPAEMLKAHQAAHEQIVEDLTQIHLNAMHGQGLPIETTIATVEACVNHHLMEFDLGMKPYIQAAC